MAKSLNKTSFMELWNNELLPSIQKLVQSEISQINIKISDLNTKFSKIEESQKFLSNKYDEFLNSLQTTKKLVSDQGQRITDSIARIKQIHDVNYNQDVAIDEIQQYQRRDCLEVTGIPMVPMEDTKSLVVELATAIGVEVYEEDISTAHRLPNTKRVKDRLIVKFIRRDKREEFYKKRSNIKGKNTSCLPSVKSHYGQNISSHANIHINESLTAYRKRLFGMVNDFKKIHKHKFLWTSSGKILLRENDNSRIYTFTTVEQFEDYKSTIVNINR